MLVLNPNRTEPNVYLQAVLLTAISSLSATYVNTTSVEGLMQKDRRVTSRRMVFDHGLSYGTVLHEVDVLQHLT
jgi:hypothetical protein